MLMNRIELITHSKQIQLFDVYHKEREKYIENEYISGFDFVHTNNHAYL